MCHCYKTADQKCTTLNTSQIISAELTLVACSLLLSQMLHSWNTIYEIFPYPGNNRSASRYREWCLQSTIDKVRFLMLNYFFSLSSYLTRSRFKTKVKVLFIPTFPDLRNSIAFWRWVWSIGGMKLAGANRSTPRQTFHSGTLPSTATNLLGHSTAYCTNGLLDRSAHSSYRLWRRSSCMVFVTSASRMCRQIVADFHVHNCTTLHQVAAVERTDTAQFVK